MINLFIPSYHRPDNLKTVKLFLRLGWDPSKIIVFIDDETDDCDLYKSVCEKYGCRLHVFNMEEARKRYDFVHRQSVSRRSAGLSRNMFQDYAIANGIDFYVVQDDDSSCFELKKFGRSIGPANGKLVSCLFDEVEKFMRKRKIGVFGLSQSGDYIGGEKEFYYMRKVMNTTFYLLPYIYRGERGLFEPDTSLYVTLWNEGYFTGSCADGLVLHQMPSAVQKGGLTDSYVENGLLCKSLVTVIQFPSAIKATKQLKNGGRLHHLISYKNLGPKILKIKNGNDNIGWGTYPEDVPFTNEPKR